MDNTTLDAWNSLAQSSSAQTYNKPSVNEIDDFSVVDSSGNVASGLNFGSILKGGGSIFSAFGDILAGQEANEANQFNAQLALDQGNFAIDNLDLEESHMLSTQKAIYAKSGVTQSGSPLDTALNTATQFEMSKQVAKYNAQSKANVSRWQGEIAESQGQIKAGKDLLSGAASMILGG